MAYYRRRGTLNPNRKLEWGFALLATLIHNALSKDPKQITDFMPYHEDEEPISLDKAMETWN